MSVFKPRATCRNRPICWHNCTMQFVNTIVWPSYFYEYERQEKDLVAESFKFIKQLRTNQSNPIDTATCNNIANKFIQYVNHQKSKHRKPDQPITSEPWHI